MRGWGSPLRLLVLLLLLLLLLAPTALAVEINIGACGALAPPPAPCVAWRHLARGHAWPIAQSAGAFVATTQAELDAIVDEFEPDIDADFAREFVVVLIEEQGTPSDIGVLDVVTPGAGSYAVGYYSVWGPSDIEYGVHGYHVVAISREASAPTSVLFVGPYSAWDPRFNP